MCINNKMAPLTYICTYIYNILLHKSNEIDFEKSVCNIKYYIYVYILKGSAQIRVL